MNDIAAWLDQLGLGELAKRFAEQHVDWDVLQSLDEADLRELGLTLGQRRKLQMAMKSMQGLASVAELGLAEAPPPPLKAPTSSTSSTPSTTQGPSVGLEAQRRQMTILFADMVGSTDVASRLDPEDMFAVVGAFQRRCTEVVRQHGGHVAQYLGDGLLAYFGFPTAGEDDAERAVMAGLDLVGAVQRLKPRGNVELHARVGIDTGLVVIGDLLTGGPHDEDAVVGETPNLAARLQSMAAVDGVLISTKTRQLVGDLFQLVDAGEHVLKGFRDPVPVWRVLGQGHSDDRFAARAGGAVGALVGREHELRLLIDRWQLAREGEGQVVLLTGEAGIGKSRLLHALNAGIEAERPSRVRYFCAQFHSQTSLFPVIEQIKRDAGLARHHDVQGRLDRLDALLQRFGEDPATAGPLLATLCSLDVSDRYPSTPLSPTERKQRTFQLVLRQMAAMAKERPLLLQAEDVHWMDPMSLELLGLLVDRARALPMLLVITARPEFQPPWPLPAHVTQLRLNRFARAQAAALMDRIAQGMPLPEEVRQRILERCDGIPLFVEEVTKAMLESGAIEQRADGWAVVGELPTIRIPSTLHDSLMARLDRLGSARESALWASALGRNFTLDLLRAVVPQPATEVEAAVERLIGAGMLYRHGLDVEDGLEFKHALVQAAAYESLIRERRERMHGRIAEVLESQFADVADTRPEIVAQHYELANQPERAFPHTLRAGDKAAARYASPEAHERYRFAIDLARRLPPSEAQARLEIRAILKSASVAVGRDQVEADLRELSAARDLADRYGLIRRLAQALYWTGRLNYVAGRFSAAADFARQSLALAERTNSSELAAAGTNLLGRIHCLRGEPLAGIAYAERNVAQLQALNDTQEAAAMSGVLAFALALAGRFEDAIAAADTGVELSDQGDHLPTRAACYFFRGVVHGWRGDLTLAAPAFDAALAMAEEAGDVFRRYLVLGWRGEAELRGGEPVAAAASLGRALGIGESIGSDFHRAAYLALWAEASLTGPDADLVEARRRSLEALERAEWADEAWSRSIALRTRALVIAADGGSIEAARAVVDEAIAIQSQQGLRTDLAWSHRARARLLTLMGDAERAAASEAEADRLFLELGLRTAAA